MGLQAVLQMIYPPQCLSCDELVTSDFGLCGTCWRDTPFITGLVCDCCGMPLPGEAPSGPVHCDDCLMLPRPWARGRAVMLYKDKGRVLVLRLKHGDRIDLARPCADWMLRVARPILQPGMLLAPIPLHWLCFFTRRYNQAALLSGALARLTRLEHCPDLLLRPKSTQSQEGRSKDARFAAMAGAVRVNPRRQGLMQGRHVLLVDDVMTSGATLTAGAEACLASGASRVSILVLARVAKDA